MLKFEFGSKLAALFIRYGLEQSLKDLLKEDRIEFMNQTQPTSSLFKNHKSQGAPAREFLEHLVQDRERVEEEIHAFAHKLEEDESMDEKSREDMTAVIKKSEELLKKQDKKISELVLIEQREKLIEEKQVIAADKLGTTIASLAKTIREDNLAKMADDKESSEHSIFDKLAKLANLVKDEVVKETSSLAELEKLIKELAQSISAQKGGLTNFEFVSSGLLASIYEFLTHVPSLHKQKQLLAAQEEKDKAEETKEEKPKAESQAP